MRILWVVVMLFSWTGTVAMASPDSNGTAAFERAPLVSAPTGTVAYEVRIWGARASGRFTEAGVDEFGRLRLRAEAGDDGHVGPITVDKAVTSVIFLAATFKPRPELLALRVKRPAEFHLSTEAPAPFYLRLVGDDPSDPTFRLYETHFPGKVVTGTLTGFEVDDATVKRGYPYRGPITFRGWTNRRPANYPGEKSIVRIPVDVTIPEILIYRP